MKKNNKGFTLVELIVVIAILGVLMAVLVPQYIQYVEKSRIGTDESAIGEVTHTMELAAAGNESVIGVAADVLISIDANGKAVITVSSVTPATATDASADLLAELKTVFPNGKTGDDAAAEFSVKSKAYKAVKTMHVILDANGKTKWLGYDQTAKTYTAEHGSATGTITAVDASVRK